MTKNYTRKGGNNPQFKWKVTLENGKTKTVKADSSESVKDHLSTSELIIGIKKVVKVNENIDEIVDRYITEGITPDSQRW